MAFISGDVVVRQVDAKYWELREPVVYAGKWETFTVPTGFVTDFASVPRAFAWLLPTYGLYTRAAILHDYLVRQASVGADGAPVSRADADGLFRRSMRELGVSIPRRWMMWSAIRAESLLRDATPTDVAAFAVAAPLSAAFVALPAVVVQVFLVLFWIVELAFWAVERLAGHPRARPRLQLRTA